MATERVCESNYAKIKIDKKKKTKNDKFYNKNEKNKNKSKCKGKNESKTKKDEEKKNNGNDKNNDNKRGNCKNNEKPGQKEEKKTNNNNNSPNNNSNPNNSPNNGSSSNSNSSPNPNKSPNNNNNNINGSSGNPSNNNPNNSSNSSSSSLNNSNSSGNGALCADGDEWPDFVTYLINYKTFNEKVLNIDDAKTRDVATLANELKTICDGDTSYKNKDRLKVWSFYYWMINKIKYDYKGLRIDKIYEISFPSKFYEKYKMSPTGKDDFALFKQDDYEFLREVDKNNDPIMVLKERKCICRGFSYLFHDFCTFFGFKSYYIIGLFKSNYKIGDPYLDDTEGNHIWNSVEIGSKVFLCDPTHGASPPDEATGSSKLSLPEPYYFFIPPNALIYSHYPCKTYQNFQYLDSPLTIQQFCDLPALRIQFFIKKLKCLSHDKGIIKCSKNDIPLKLRFEFPEDVEGHFSLIKLDDNSDTTIPVDKQGNQLTAELKPSSFGNYEFELYVCKAVLKIGNKTDKDFVFVGSFLVKYENI